MAGEDRQYLSLALSRPHPALSRRERGNRPSPASFSHLADLARMHAEYLSYRAGLTGSHQKARCLI